MPLNRNTAPAERHPAPVAFLAIAAVWLIGFNVWFHSFGLPNNKPLQRWVLWQAIPYDLMDLIDPQVKPNAVPWSVLCLFERVPFLLVAIAIWLAAWGLGAQFLRLMKLKLHGCEHLFFSMCLGMAGLSLMMLALGVCGIMNRWVYIAIVTGCILCEPLIRYSQRRNVGLLKSIAEVFRVGGVSRLGWIVIIAVFPFLFGQLLGAMSPQTDFDVVEYHLGGPKEWFQQGQISRLPHNVYTSFPFLTEMLILLSMIVYGDWQWGALAGQAVIAGFAPITALGLLAAGRRFFSDAVGWIAALVYLTSPWTYRISIIAYAEGGLACYLFAALFASLIYRRQLVDSELPESEASIGLVFLAGLLAGSAMACKYTGAYAVVVPIGLLLLATTISKSSKDRIRRGLIVGCVFSAGVMSSIGPWLLKNAVQTGNPVYPLAVRVFGGVDRDDELDVKWRRAHAAWTFGSWNERLNNLSASLADVAANNDWHSPLMFGLAPLSLLTCFRRRKQPMPFETRSTFDPGELAIIWIYVAWQFLCWWLFTHHIDRFYVPMFSVVALLAGVGWRWWESDPSIWTARPILKYWNGLATLLIFVSMLYNADVMLWIGGFNAGRIDLTVARDRIAVDPRIAWINQQYESGQLPSNTKVLCVGEALLFHARFPYLYNTVFDHSIFQELCERPDSGGQMRSAEEIEAEFRRLGITHIEVNWSEILRYRQPGNYGYTDFVHPDRFVELQKIGVLGSSCMPPELGLTPMTNEFSKTLAEWAPSLITTRSGKPYYISSQLFPVLDRSKVDRSP